MYRIVPAAAGAALLLSACGGSSLPQVARLSEARPVDTSAAPPPGADPNACYARDVTPAVYETITEQVLLQPTEVAADGTVHYPAVYRTITSQAILQERRELWFETPCEHEQTPEFVASLQRALQARGFYGGPINGEANWRTRRAVRAYQKTQGLDSAVLSRDAARQLGLVAHEGVPEGWTRIERP